MNAKPRSTRAPLERVDPETSASSTLRERKKLAAWHAIRAAAFEVFEDQGHDATTIDDMATAANVSRATFSNYFGSKSAVVFEEELGDRSSHPRGARDLRSRRE